MKIKKIDLSGVKDYLFQKGERVGLVVCGVIAVLLFISGIMKAVGSSAPYAENFKKPRLTLEERLKPAPNLPPPPPPTMVDPWPYKPVVFNDITPLVTVGDKGDSDRRNPEILKILDDADHLKIDYRLGGYFSYELEAGEKVKAWGGDKNMAAAQPGQVSNQKLTKIVKPVRMVIVSAVFPMKALWEEYCRALNIPNVAELKNNDLYKDDRPKTLGLVVYRREVKPVFKETDWEKVYGVKDNKIDVAERIDKLFREAYIDEITPALIHESHFQPGDKLMTPLPLLANANIANANIQYPDINFKEIKVLDRKLVEKGGLNPNVRKGIVMPGAALPAAGGKNMETNWDSIAWDKLEKGLGDKFAGKIDFFDPSGILGDPDNPVITRKKLPKIKGTTTTDEKVDTYDKVVRFVDIDVEPEKTYQYIFWVRMANPNYNRKEDVVFTDLASIKELTSPPSYSPEITIPKEYFYYAVDQLPDNKIPDGSNTEKSKGEPPTPYGQWNTPIQIQSWLPKIGDKTVADWAVAERLLIRRGETMGRHDVTAEVPVWNKEKEAFEIGFEVQQVGKKNRPRAGTGLPINFVPDKPPPPLLVDFEGGLKIHVKVGPQPPIKDESAVEMLILTSEGKLTVRNSRIDSDDPDRIARWTDWHNGIVKMRMTPKK